MCRKLFNPALFRDLNLITLKWLLLSLAAGTSTSIVETLLLDKPVLVVRTEEADDGVKVVELAHVL